MSLRFQSYCSRPPLELAFQQQKALSGHCKELSGSIHSHAFLEYCQRRYKGLMHNGRKRNTCLTMVNRQGGRNGAGGGWEACQSRERWHLVWATCTRHCLLWSKSPKCWLRSEETHWQIGGLCVEKRKYFPSSENPYQPPPRPNSMLHSPFWHSFMLWKGNNRIGNPAYKAKCLNYFTCASFHGDFEKSDPLSSC